MQMWFEGTTQDGITKIINLATVACVEKPQAPDTSGFIIWFIAADYGIKMKGEYEAFKKNLLQLLDSQ